MKKLLIVICSVLVCTNFYAQTGDVSFTSIGFGFYKDDATGFIYLGDQVKGILSANGDNYKAYHLGQQQGASSAFIYSGSYLSSASITKKSYASSYYPAKTYKRGKPIVFRGEIHFKSREDAYNFKSIKGGHVNNAKQGVNISHVEGDYAADGHFIATAVHYLPWLGEGDFQFDGGYLGGFYSSDQVSGSSFVFPFENENDRFTGTGHEGPTCQDCNNINHILNGGSIITGGSSTETPDGSLVKSNEKFTLKKLLNNDSGIKLAIKAGLGDGLRATATKEGTIPENKVKDVFKGIEKEIEKELKQQEEDKKLNSINILSDEDFKISFRFKGLITAGTSKKMAFGYGFGDGVVELVETAVNLIKQQAGTPGDALFREMIRSGNPWKTLTDKAKKKYKEAKEIYDFITNLDNIKNLYNKISTELGNFIDTTTDTNSVEGAYNRGKLTLDIISLFVGAGEAKAAVKGRAILSSILSRVRNFKTTLKTLKVTLENGVRKLKTKSGDLIAEGPNVKKVLEKISKPTRKFWTETATFKNVKVYKRNDIFDPKLVDKDGLTNLQRMQAGKAPIGKDGKSVNLHHMLQSEAAGIAEVTETFHKLNHKIIHINPNTVPSGINRNQFNTWKRNYWKNRANDF